MQQKYTEKKLYFGILGLTLLLYLMGFLGGLVYGKGLTANLIVLGGIFILFIPWWKILKYFMYQLLGIQGELKVETILDELYTSGVRVVPSVLLSEKGNIDHVVISPKGIFTIETKNWNGTFTVKDGELLQNQKKLKWKNPVKQAYAEAKTLKSYLEDNNFKKISVTPILAIVGKFASVRLGPHKTNGVYIVGSTWIKNIVLDTKQKKMLSSEQINSIVEMLKKVS